MGLTQELSTGLSARTVLIVSLAALLAVPNAMLVGESIGFILERPYMYDWWLYIEAVERLGTGELYTWGAPMGPDIYDYRYSPLFAYLVAPFTWAGIGLWRLLHFAVLAFLPWRVAVFTVLLWPFWQDVAHGNIMVFVFVAGYLAIKGNPWATGAFIVLALLVPRPLMIPLIGWVLWTRPEWRVRTAWIVGVYVALTLATGEAWGFLWSLGQSTEYATIVAYNFSPTAIVGYWWLLAGIPLAVWLTVKGRVGWAGLAVSPYILPYYLLLLVWPTRTESEPPRRGP